MDETDSYYYGLKRKSIPFDNSNVSMGHTVPGGSNSGDSAFVEK